MVVSEDILEEINEKAILYDASISKIKARIESKIKVAIERLDSIKSELLDEVERELGRNPFAEFSSNKDKYTDAGAKRLLAEQKIPENFGPDEKSFSMLLKEIDSFRAWQNELDLLNFVPKDLRVNNVTCDSIALSWAAVNSDCIYEIELRSLTSSQSVHHANKAEYTFYNLEPGTKHHVRVRAVFLRNDMKCIWCNPITVKTKSLCVRDVAAKTVSWGEMDVLWETDDECDKEAKYTVEMRKEGDMDWKEIKSGLTDKKCRIKGLMPDNTYEFRVKCVAKGGSSVSEWSDVVKGRTDKKFNECVWKKCPDGVDENMKYFCELVPRVATKIGDDGCCTIIGNTYIPLNKVTSWNIKMLRSRDNDGCGIYIGVAPNGINQNVSCNYYGCGWYFDCYYSTLRSGPPHSYDGKAYGPMKRPGQYVHTGDSVGVVMDTTRGDLSFVLNGVNLGVAYDKIPLDKPLVPCVLLCCQGDSVELII